MTPGVKPQGTHIADRAPPVLFIRTPVASSADCGNQAPVASDLGSRYALHPSLLTPSPGFLLH